MTEQRKKVFSGAIDKSKLSGLSELMGPPPAPAPAPPPVPVAPAPVQNTPAQKELVQDAPGASAPEPKPERVYRTSLNIKYSEEQRNKLWLIRSALNKSIGELAMDAIGEYIERFEAEHGEIILPEILGSRGREN